MTSHEGFLDVPGGRVWYAKQGSEGGTPLLCLHGGPGMPHDYLEPLAGLGERRPVVFYDELGCGRSAGPTDPELFTIERHIQELAAVREALDLDDVHILGQSWGGVISYALSNPTGSAATSSESVVQHAAVGAGCRAPAKRAAFRSAGGASMPRRS